MFANVKEAAAEENKDDDSSDPEEKNEAPTTAVDSSKVEQKNTFGKVVFNENTKLFNSKIFKFKVVAPKDFTRKIEESTVSLEQASGDKKTTMLVVRSAVKTLFVGVVDPSLSKIKRVAEKAA